MQPDTAGTAPAFRRDHLRARHAEAPMPYKSRAEQESENWMTLPQVLAHIKSVDGLDNDRKARSELLKALTNGAFYSRRRYLIRWKDQICISGPPPNEIGPRDIPPRGQEWAQAKISWASGKVLDRYGAAKDGKWEPAWRVVWLARSKVMKLWPRPRLSDAPAAIGASISTNVVPVKGRETGPKTDSSIWRQQTEEEYQNRLNTYSAGCYPTREEDEKWGKEKGYSRARVRELRNHFIPEAIRKGGAPKKNVNAEPGQK